MSDIQDNIFRDGTSQQVRYNSGLDPQQVLVDGRDREYYLRYMARLSSIIRFYDRLNIPAGHWDAFFPEEAAIPSFLATLQAGKALPPQQALFIAFTRLMEVLKGDINQLSARHLRFYFQQVLQFQRQQAVAEKANIVFDPAPNLPAPIVLPAGLELLAGKAANGTPIIFTTHKELTVSTTNIAQVSSVLTDATQQWRIYVAPKADSADGVATPLPKEAPYWNPFGETQADKTPEERTMADGKAGFAIASSSLLLQEGERTITITLRCRNYRFTSLHFDAMRTDGVPDTVVQLMQPMAGLVYPSYAAMQDAIVALIGDTAFAADESKITVYITQPLLPVSDAEIAQAFVAEATGAKGWFAVTDMVTSKLLERDLRFQITLTKNDPAIVDLHPLIHQQSIDTTLPVIQWCLNHAGDTYLYDQLRGLQIQNVSIVLDVKGVTNLVLLSDNGPINPTQPFLPFGAVPSVGSTFYFGSREVFSKPLTKLDMELWWMNLPQDNKGFSDYYAEYPAPPANEKFTASFSVLDQCNWSAGTAVPLFDTLTVGVPAGSQRLNQGIFTVPLPVPALEEEPLPDIRNLDSNLSRGFGRLTLNDPDFGHTIYPKLYAEKAILKATTIPTQALPNAPFLPKLKRFALNYMAEVSFVPAATPTATGDRVLQVEPLGLVPMNEQTAGELLPQLAQGTLYIGLKNLQPPQNISILFQLVEGSANPDVTLSRNDVQWSYFNKTRWKNFADTAIQLDTTYGLQTSGIIEFLIGSDVSDNAAFWARGQYWIRAQFAKDPSGASKVAGLFTNAMAATLRQDQADAGVLPEPLPPGSISKLAATHPLIKAIRQPFTSFAGKGIEPENDLNRRVSERLRHKNRAVNLWDYEHIVLEAFPAIYKVKCLPHTGRTSDVEPGAVTLLVIPDLRKRNKINPFEPRVSAVVRNQIGDHVTGLNSGVAKVYVDNPYYEQVLVEMSVGLMPGYDGSFYGRLLNEELKRFLSPWAYEEGKDIVFGGRIFKSSILAFIEQREYVNYVTNFKLYHLQRGPGIDAMKVREDLIESIDDIIVRDDTVGDEMDYEIVASSPRSILVTAAAHKITVLDPGQFICPGTGSETGIEAMIIEVDFIVDNTL